MVSKLNVSMQIKLWQLDIRSAGMFLSRLPVGGAPAVMPRALRAFPIVGGMVGGFGGLVFWGAAGLGFSPLISGVICLMAMALATGALHEDGLADTADGFGGGGSAEDRLRIMRDSRIGTFGAVALVLMLALRAALLADLSLKIEALPLVFALVAAGAAGRLAPVVILWALPPVRSSGLGEAAGRPGSDILRQSTAAFIIISLPAMAVLSFSSFLAACLASAIALVLFSRLSHRQIGGQTGDVAGTSAILTETIFWAGLAMH